MQNTEFRTQSTHSSGHHYCNLTPFLYVTVTRCLRIGFFSEKYFNMIEILQNGIIGVTENSYTITKYLTPCLKPEVYFTALILSANTVLKNGQQLHV